MTQRLPIPGSDDDTWGSILNGFLGVSLDSAGNLLTGAVSAAGAEMTSNKDTDGTLAANSDAKYASQKATKTYADTKVGQSTTVNGHALSSNVTVTATDVGLSNVTNDAQLKAANLDTDGTLTANSDTKIASQKATKTYADTTIAAKVQTSTIGGTQIKLKGLDSWYTTLATASTTAAKIVVIGDSIASLSSTAWPWLLTQGMAIYGNSYSPDQGYYFAAHLTYSNDLGATVGTTNNNGVAGWANTLTTGQVITKTMSCKAITVVYTKQSGGGTIVVSDGTTTQNITTSAGTTSYSNLTTVTFPSYASRTVTFTASGSSVTMEGAYIHADATTGVQIWNASHSGYTTNDFVGSSTNGDPNSHALNLIQNLVPDLVIMATDYNDVTTANYSNWAQQLITNIRGVGSMPILLISPWNNIRQAMGATARSLAAANTNVAAIDFYTPLGNISHISPSNDPFAISVDGTHPTAEGQALQADIVQAAISGDPIGTALTTQMRGYNRNISGATATISGAATVAGILTTNTKFLADLGAANGSVSVGGYGVYPIVGITNQTDTYWQAILTSAGLASILGAPGAALVFGPGGANVPDTWISRTSDGGLATSGAVLPINAQTGTTYTFVKADAGKLVTSTNSSAQTLTIPANATTAFPIGSVITVTQAGTGTLTVTGATGVTVNGVSAGSLATSQYNTVLARKTATDTWIGWTQGPNGGIVIDTDGTLAANSDAKVASQKATKTYVDTSVATGAQPNTLGGTPVRLKGLDSWYTALGNAQTTAPKVVVIGDSVASLGSGSWPWLLTQGMAIYGNSYSPDQSYYYAASNSFSKDLGATVGTTNNNGVAGWANTLTTGQVITKTMSCKAITVVYTKQSGGGTIVVSDGTTTQNITTSAGTTSYSNLTTVTFPSYASRTVTFTASGSSVTMEGAYIHADATTGVQIWNTAHSGFTTNDYVASGTYGNASSHALNLIQNLVPDLVVVNTGLIESSSSYGTWVQSFINNIQAVGSIPILLATPWARGDTAIAARTLAAANTGVATVSMYTQLGNVTHATPANDPFAISPDGYNATPEGQALQADIVQAAISGDPIGTALTTQMRGYNRNISGATASLSGAATVAGILTTNTKFVADLGATHGSATLGGYGPNPIVGITNAAETYWQVLITYASLASSLGAPGAALFFGPGGSTIPDTWLSRTSDGGLATSGAVLPINAQTGTTYTFVKADAGKLVTASNASAQTHTIPANASVAFPIGCRLTIAEIGAGALTVVGATGVTVNGVSAGSLGCATNQTIVANKIATNTWVAYIQSASSSGVTIDTDATMAANSDTVVASQKATKTYVDSQDTLPVISGNWYSLPMIFPSHSLNQTSGNLLFCPIWWPGGNVSGVGINVATAQSGSSWRLGVYASVNGAPSGAELLSPGLLTTATANMQTATITSTPLAKGWYWGAVLIETASGTAATVCGQRTDTPSFNWPLGTPVDPSYSNRMKSGFMKSGVATGSMPTVPSGLTQGANVYMVALKAA